MVKDNCCAAVTSERALRQLIRQLTFVDIERSLTMVGENETPEVLNGDAIGYLHRKNDANDRKVAIITGATVSLLLP